jgi:SAM-dependent methyltransferase
MVHAFVDTGDGDDYDPWTAPTHIEAYGRLHRQLAAWSAGVDHLMAKASSPAPGERVLDLASGTGLPAHTLASLVGPTGTVVALDRCSGMLAVAIAEADRLGLDNLRAHVADAHELPFPDDSFDLVTCRFGAGWFAEPRQALAEAERVLRPGGRACFVVAGSPNQPMLNAFHGTVCRSLGVAWPNPHRPSPLRHSRAGSLSEDLRAAGFGGVQERSEHVDGYWSGSGAQVWELATTRLGPMLDHLPAKRRLSLGRTVVASLERHRRGKVLHLPLHVHLATAHKGLREG